MPAINVARTDTFEVQRQKINQIGANLFQISQGGSDLSTGNLKLGDGTRISPSLAFINESSLGIFRPNVGTIGFVSAEKNLFDITTSGQINYKNLTVQKRVLTTSGLEIVSPGSGYDPGNYLEIPTVGGTGDGATLDIEVTEFVGSITNAGEDYNGGTYTGVKMSGGSGSGARASVIIETVSGDITNEGFGYKPGLYTGISLNGGSGDNNLVGSFNITGDTITSGSITQPGSSYVNGTYTNVSLINAPTTTFNVSVVSNPGTPPPDNIYQINSLNKPVLTLDKGNTYAFDISDSSLIGHPFTFGDSTGLQLNNQYYRQRQVGVAGNSGAVIYFTILPDAPTETIQYYCAIHPNMGSTINIQSGTLGNSGRNISANIEVVGNSVSTVSITNSGTGYNPGDTLIVSPGDVGSGLSGGSGFLYTISSITFEGIVSDLTITNEGTNYLNGDILTVNDSDLGSGGGSGFEFTITSNPGQVKSIDFDLKGSGYLPNDILTLPGSVTNVNVPLNGSVSNVTATLSTSSTSFTVADSTGIVGGMEVTSALVGTGQVGAGTIVQGVFGNTITLNQAPTTSGEASLSFTTGEAADLISVSSAVANQVGTDWTVIQTGGAGQIDTDTVVSSVNNIENTITLSKEALLAGGATLSFIPPWGIPTTQVAYNISSIGAVDTITINYGGNGYSKNDILSVLGTDLIQPEELVVTNQSFQELTFTGTVSASFINAGDTLEYASGLIVNTGVVISKVVSGSDLVSILVESLGVVADDEITKVGNPTTLTIATATDTSRWFIDGALTPNLTLYVGNSYLFNTEDSSNSGHLFSLSAFEGGSYNTVSGLTSTLSVTSNIILVSDTTGILPGMAVTSSGDGVVSLNTIVTSVDGPTQITLSETPSVSGSASLTFRGTEYTNGTSRPGSGLLFKVTEDTPSTLYYYCNSGGSEHENEGLGAVITVDPNNPKVFGSGLQIIVANIAEQDVITLDVLEGKVISQAIDVEDGTIDDLTVNTLLSTKTVNVQQKVVTPEVESLSSLTLDTPDLKISGSVNVSSGKLTINSQNGNLVSSGTIRTNSGLNVNNILTITNNEIVTTGTNDIRLIPALNRVAKVSTTTAFVIPTGNTGQRPIAPIAQNGAIRFNSQTNQYEGYSETNAQWSSLGGVRDLDGNTTILAEETVGANDNTLWFINDNVNTVRFSPSYLEFVNVKKVRSPNIAAPAYSNWTAQAPVSLGDYLKYRNNIYVVSSVSNPGGTNLLAVSGSEPIHTTGSETNGDVILTWYISAVSTLTFDEISEVQIDPLGFTNLVVNNQLRFSKNRISSTSSDILIDPSGSQKVKIDAQSSLVIPVGDNNSKGNPERGSIRYNTEDSQFEGYNGAQWGGLGGVKDINQDTYIIPETSPNANEDILYFFNANDNTIRVTTTAFEFDTIDTITSGTSDTLNIDVGTVTFDSLATTLDNTSSTETFLFSTKNNFDFGLSSGLNTDHLLRLTNTGQVIFNLGFGTGTDNNLTLLNSTLTSFNLKNVRYSTNRINLVRGTINTGNALIYNTSTESSAKLFVTAHNTTTGDKELVEFLVSHKGNDVFFIDTSNIKTGNELISTVFDIDPLNNVRITVTANSSLTVGNNIEVTVVNTTTKR